LTVGKLYLRLIFALLTTAFNVPVICAACKRQRLSKTPRPESLHHLQVMKGRRVLKSAPFSCIISTVALWDYWLSYTIKSQLFHRYKSNKEAMIGDGECSYVHVSHLMATIHNIELTESLITNHALESHWECVGLSVSKDSQRLAMWSHDGWFQYVWLSRVAHQACPLCKLPFAWIKLIWLQLLLANLSKTWDNFVVGVMVICTRGAKWTVQFGLT
jgi:hypothetical protein